MFFLVIVSIISEIICTFASRIIFTNYSTNMIMSNIKKITKTPFYEITANLDFWARWDTIVRTDNLPKGGKITLLPHEELLHNVQNILNGIVSSFTYMHLSVLQVQRRYNSKYFMGYGYKEYDVYRYHYFVFCHSVTTIHDLLFKLVIELCDIHLSKRMVQWEDLHKQLEVIGETKTISLLQDFYGIIKEHEKKRHKVSHEGLLASRLLDNYYSTYVWTNAHRNSIENTKPEYTEGTKENKYLLGKTKKTFIAELNGLADKITEKTISLLELLLPKLIVKMDSGFINSHKQHFIELNNKNINYYVLTRF